MSDEWMSRGTCRIDKTIPPDTFFPGKNEPQKLKKAREVCSICPVKEECLDYALSNYILHGIWGGTSERQRRSMRYEKKIPYPDFYDPTSNRWINVKYRGSEKKNGN